MPGPPAPRSRGRQRARLSGSRQTSAPPGTCRGDRAAVRRTGPCRGSPPADGSDTAPAAGRPRSRTNKAQGKRYMRMYGWPSTAAPADPGLLAAPRRRGTGRSGASPPAGPRGAAPAFNAARVRRGGFPARVSTTRGAACRPPVTPAAGAGNAPGRSGPGRGQKGRRTPYGTNLVPVYPIRHPYPLKQRLELGHYGSAQNLCEIKTIIFIYKDGLVKVRITIAARTPRGDQT